MVVFWKVLLTILILYTIAIDGNRARRRRRQAPLANPNPVANSLNQQQVPPNPQILNAPGQPPFQQGNQNDFGTAKQGGRQYYNSYGGQSGGYGSVQGLNYPYAGAGVGSYQYGSGQYGQYGTGQMGQMGQYGQYGGSYNQYPGYSSYGGSSYNRPGSSNYYPQSGSGYGGGYGGNNYGGGYFWNAGQKQNINMFTVFLSSLLTLVICLITV